MKKKIATGSGRVERFVSWFLCKNNRHNPSEVKISEEKAELCEPRGTPREVVIRIGIIECTRCKKLLSLHPMGIIYDPKYTS